MHLFYYVSLVFAFVAAFVAARALAPAPSQVYEMRRRAEARVEAQTIQSPLLRIFWPLLSALVPVARRIGSPAYRQQKSRELPLAGFPPAMTVDHLLAMKLVLPVLAFLAIVAILNSPLAAVVAAGLGYILPDRMIAEQKTARERRIVRGLPGAVDMLTLAVESGLDFIAALQRVVDKGGEGPLRDEIATIISDIRLGESRSGALRRFADRISVPEVVSFVAVLVQADRLGASIGQVLRTQSDRMRTERFQRAEKAGAAASQKLLVPLAVFIFPAVLLVIIGPIAVTFILSGSLF